MSRPGRRNDRLIERLRVEPFSTYLEARRPGPIYPVTVAAGFVYVSGLPPFDPETGQVTRHAIERQTEIVLDQMRRCLEAAGSSMTRVLKCNLYCSDVAHFGRINDVYAKYFPLEAPARIFLCVPCWPGPFDIEIDCVAVVDPGRSRSRAEAAALRHQHPDARTTAQ